jgi:glycosyltransferase involved in cell wall biosynthesis
MTQMSSEKLDSAAICCCACSFGSGRGQVMAPASNQANLLLSVFPSFRIGGAQGRFAKLANHFGARFRHVIVSMDGIFDCRDRLSSDVPATFMTVRTTRHDLVQNRRRLRKVLKEVRPDCLVTHNWGTVEWALGNWPPVVRHVHIEDGFGPEEAHRRLWRRALFRQLALRRSAIAVPSRGLERIATTEWKLPVEHVHFIPNGIDRDRFERQGIVPIVPRRDCNVIGTVAALRPEKNLHRLLEAFRLVRDGRPCQLLIAGDGSERSALEARARELGIAQDVIFLGHIEDVERVYAALDLFVLSSDTEQMPFSLIEAMAAGLAVAGTRVGDVPQMVSAQNEPFIVQLDATALAGAMAHLLDNPGLRLELGVANRRVAHTEFSQEGMFAAYEKLFGEPTTPPQTGG